jgi:hypothetical protein
MNENVELSKNVEEYSDDFEIESYEKQEGFNTLEDDNDVHLSVKKQARLIKIKWLTTTGSQLQLKWS